MRQRHGWRRGPGKGTALPSARSSTSIIARRGALPEKKTVSLMVADGSFGRIRSAAPGASPPPSLNVDARPTLVANDKILLELTVEYQPPAAREAGGPRPANLNESLTIILQNGKPIVVSQAADPAADRKMTVEVRASIVK